MLGAESQPGALRKGPGLLRVWGWWPIDGVGSPSTEMSLDKTFGLNPPGCPLCRRRPSEALLPRPTLGLTHGDTPLVTFPTGSGDRPGPPL